MNVFLQILALFILMAVGFAAGKLKILEGQTLRGMSSFIIKITLPALILVSMQRPFSAELFGTAWFTLILATVFYTGIIILSLTATRLLLTPQGQRGVFAFSLSFSNAAFIGFPVVQAILGTEALFLTAIHTVLFNILAFSAGVVMVSRDALPAVMGATLKDITGTVTKNPRSTLRTAGALLRSIPWKHLANINVVAAAAGFTLFALSVSIPQAVKHPLEMLGSVTTPLALIVTGAMLSRARVHSVFGDWRIYAATVLRLAVWPLVTFAVLRLLGIGGMVAAITVIIAGMPAASNTSLIAEVYGGDADKASALVFMTTLGSIVTIPLLALLVG